MKIVVAGAGHGGLAAAALLAEAGHDVTLYEKKQRNQLGHDWEDRFTFDILLDITGEKALPEEVWRFRGDCSFISPDYNTSIDIHYTDENRQKIMWRKPLINMLIDNAEKHGAKLCFEKTVNYPLTDGKKVSGVIVDSQEIYCDLVIDALGAFSALRTNLPDSFCIEKSPERGDVFYAYRAYFDRNDYSGETGIPFEVYLCHSGEQGLSWCCTNDESVDILIGRIDPLEDDLIDFHIKKFRQSHPWTGNSVLHGGHRGIIPVRRPLAIMTAEGYAAVGDSAFMTTPMNGMGIDLSLLAGKLLAETVIKNESASAQVLWQYNRDYHLLYGAQTAKNESLKNSLLNLPPEGVSFLFSQRVVQASDLAGAGRNMNIGTLLGKFRRGMKNPGYFFKVLGGIINGAKLSKAFADAPEVYDEASVRNWQKKVQKQVLKVTRAK